MGQPGPGGGKPWGETVVTTTMKDETLEVRITTPTMTKVLFVWKDGTISEVK
jgi:hypothetical protein